MKLIPIALLLVFVVSAHAQKHYIDVGAAAQIGFLKLCNGNVSAKVPTGTGSLSYRFIGKKNVGVSVGAEVSGFTYKASLNTNDKWNTLSNISYSSTYLGLPVMVEIEGGKKRVGFVFHAGVMANFVLSYGGQYKTTSIQFYPVYSNTTEYHNQTLTPFTPVQIGIPAGGGIQVKLTRLLLLQLTIENRLFLKSFNGYEGTLNALGLREALTFDVKRKDTTEQKKPLE